MFTLLFQKPYMSDWRFQADILSILRNTRKPLATLIANSWEYQYDMVAPNMS